MTKKEKGAQIAARLAGLYPATCSLDARKDYELLFATRLAAQCTDARVNLVTPVLFGRYPTLEALAQADLDELADIVRPCGLYLTKARDIKAAAGLLLDRFGGRVPDTMDELLSLPGVGRKTANLILSDIYGQPAVVTDTHCIRIANRLGLCADRDPYKVELALADLIAPEEQAALCHRFVHFGREICKARAPLCGNCALCDLCDEYGGRAPDAARPHTKGDAV